MRIKYTKQEKQKITELKNLGADELFIRGCEFLESKISITNSIKEELAAICFSYAIRLGHNVSRYKLAMLLLEGGGRIKKDTNRACNLLTQAAENGCITAQYTLGRLYNGILECGTGIIVDKVKAAYWYSEAGKQGSEDAKLALHKLLQDNITEVAMREQAGSAITIEQLQKFVISNYAYMINDDQYCIRERKEMEYIRKKQCLLDYYTTINNELFDNFITCIAIRAGISAGGYKHQNEVLQAIFYGTKLLSCLIDPYPVVGYASKAINMLCEQIQGLDNVNRATKFLSLIPERSKLAREVEKVSRVITIALEEYLESLSDENIGFMEFLKKQQEKIKSKILITNLDTKYKKEAAKHAFIIIKKAMKGEIDVVHFTKLELVNMLELDIIIPIDLLQNKLAVITPSNVGVAKVVVIAEDEVATKQYVDSQFSEIIRSKEAAIKKADEIDELVKEQVRTEMDKFKASFADYNTHESTYRKLRALLAVAERNLLLAEKRSIVSTIDSFGGQMHAAGYDLEAYNKVQERNRQLELEICRLSEVVEMLLQSVAKIESENDIKTLPEVTMYKFKVAVKVMVKIGASQGVEFSKIAVEEALGKSLAFRPKMISEMHIINSLLRLGIIGIDATKLKNFMTEYLNEKVENGFIRRIYKRVNCMRDPIIPTTVPTAIPNPTMREEIYVTKSAEEIEEMFADICSISLNEHSFSERYKSDNGIGVHEHESAFSAKVARHNTVRKR